MGGAKKKAIDEYMNDFVSFLDTYFMQEPNAWTSNGADAVMLRWAAEKNKTKKERFGHAVDEYIKRWKTTVYPSLNTSAYTCGSLIGISSLLGKQDSSDAAQLVHTVLHLIE